MQRPEGWPWTFPMPSKPDRHPPRPQSRPSPGLPRAGESKPAKAEPTRGERPCRVRGLDPTDLFAHVCEVMRLFPGAGDQAIAEMVGRLKREKVAAATAGKVRPGGRRRNTRRRA